MSFEEMQVKYLVGRQAFVCDLFQMAQQDIHTCVHVHMQLVRVNEWLFNCFSNFLEVSQLKIKIGGKVLLSVKH
jgi:hypothetical protein